MTYTVANQIGHLLYLHNTVIVPDLGGFEGKVKGASIDHIHGKITPPRKVASFNPNLLTNDGLLIDSIAKASGCSVYAAREEVLSFVQECRERFQSKEIVQIPSVGKLYANHHNKIEFIPEDTNFQTDTYGLETVQFYPILRTAASLEDTATLRPEEAKIKRLPKRRAWLKYAIPAAIALLLAIPVANHLLSGNSSSSGDEIILQPVSEKRLNIKPKSNNLGILDVVDADGQIIDTSALRDKIKAEEKTASVIVPEEKEVPSRLGVIAIGVFGNKDNVNRLVKKIMEEGFEAHLERKRRGTMVGIKYNMDAYAKEDLVSEVQATFDKGARFLKELK